MKGRKGQADIDAGRRAIADREKAISDHSGKVNDLLAKLDTAIREEGGEATRREREANASPLWNTYIPSAAGVAGGAALGEVGNAMLRSFNKGNAQAIIEIGDELGPVSKMTNSQMNRSIASGAAKAAERYAPSSAVGKMAGTAGRLGGYAAPAGVVYNEYLKYQQRADDQSRTESDRLANQGIANALLGTSTGIALDGGLRVFYPPREPGEGRAMARINAARDYARRMDASDEARALNPLMRGARPAVDITPPARAIDVTPEPARPAIPPPRTAPAAPTEPAVPSTEPSAAPRSGTKAALVAQAKELGIKNAKNIPKADLATRVADTIRDQGTRRAPRLPKAAMGPVAAGAVGAAMGFSGDAEAADGTPRSMGSRLGDAAITGGTAAGAAYGTNRLLRALPPTVGGAMRTAGAVLGPMSAGDMTDDFASAEARNWAARNFPEALQFGAVGEAREMATVPSPSPYRQQPLAAAESLEVPSDIPAPREDGTSPYGAPAAPEPSFDDQMNELQSLLQQIGAAPDPMETAQASRAVTQLPQGFPPSNIPTNRLLAQY